MSWPRVPVERIPLDVVVTAGVSAITEALITGESVPVDKGTGDEVYAGTIADDGYLETEEMIAEGDTVAGRMTFTGTYEGDIHGVHPTGEEIEIKAMYRIKDDHSPKAGSWKAMPTRWYNSGSGRNSPSNTDREGEGRRVSQLLLAACCAY